jgi:hypothetical protein
MFIDPTLYKHYDLLQNLVGALTRDYQQVKDLDPTSYCIDVTAQEYPELTEYDDSWWAYLVYFNGLLNPDPWFTETRQLILQFPGLKQGVINYVRPGGQLPPHTDTNWERINDRWPGTTGYTIAIGIDMLMPPNADVQYIAFGADQRAHVNQEIYAFDGLHEHRVLNNADSWRVTAVFDIESSEWNVAG